MVLPPDSIAAAVKPVNSMQVTCDHLLYQSPHFFCSLSARLKDSVFEVREKALVALRGTLFRAPVPISTHLIACSHLALLQRYPEVGLPVLLSLAAAGQLIDECCR
jgi:hypothetical protein